MKKIASAPITRNASLCRSFSALRKALLILPAFAVALAGSARAQVTETWTTTTGSWASPSTNWSNSTVPGATSGTTNGDTAVFGSSGAGTVTVDAYRNIANITFNGSSAYTLSGGALYLTAGGEIQNQSASTAVENINSTINLEGNYTFDSSSSTGADVLNFGGNITEQVAGTLTLQGSNIGTGTVTLNTISGVISDNSGSTPLAISKTGSGTWVLTNANTYTGGTTITSGKLIVGNGAALGTGTITLAGGSLGGNGNVQINNNIVAMAGTTSALYASDYSSTGNTTINGNISGSGNLTTLAVDGGGGTSFILQGNDSGFTGTFTVPSGITNNNFRFRGTGSAGSANAVWIFNTGVTIGAAADPFTSAIQFGSFSGSGSISSENTSNDTIQVGNLNRNDTWSGVIGNSFAFTKVGTGTQTFTANNTYNLATAINGGAILLSGNGQIASTSSITLAGGTSLIFNTSGGFSSAAPIANGGALIGAETANGQALSGIISGTGTFAQTGGGYTLFTGTNTFSGNTTISAGTVYANNSTALGTGTIILNGGTLSSGDSTGTATYGNITLANNITAQAGTTSFLQDNQVSSFQLNGNISGSGNLTTASGAIASTILDGNNSGFTGTFTDASGPGGHSIIRFGTTTAGSANAYWVFNDASTANGGSETFQFGNGTIQFGSFTGSGVLANNAGGTTTSTIQAGNLNQNDTFSGVIVNNTGGSNVGYLDAFTKVGTGTQTFTGNNTYTGATTISSGALLLGPGGQLSGASPVSVAGGSLFILGGNGTASVGGTIANAGGIIGAETAGATTLSGIISGTGTFAQTGAGTTVMAAAETYTGNTTISAGTLQLGNGTTNGSVNSSAITLGSAGTLAFNETNGTILSSNISDSGTIAGAESAGIGLTLSGIISGPGNFSQTGSGTTTLSGANTYTGTTTVSAGTLIAGIASASGSGAFGNVGPVVVNGGTLNLNNYNETVGILSGTGGAISLGTGTLTITNSAAYSSANANASAISGTGSVILTGGSGFLTGYQTLSGASSYSGITTATNGTFVVGSNTAFGTSTITEGSGQAMYLTTLGSYNLTNAMNIQAGGLLSVYPSSGVTLGLNGNLSGAGTFDSIGTVGTVGLGGNNSGFTGTASLTNGGSGITSFTSANAGSAAAVWQFNNTNANTVAFGNGTIQFGSFTGSGNINPNLAGTETIQAGALNDNDTYSGIMGQATGSIAYTKVGTGTQTFTNNNSYNGATTISSGALLLGPGGQLSGTSGTTIAGGASLILQGNNTASVVNNIADAGSILGNETAGTTTLGGVISGTGTFAQTGAGITILSNSNTFSGGATASNGNLVLNNNNAAGTGTLTLAGGGLTSSNTIGNNFFAQAGTTTSLYTNANGSSGNWTYTGTLTGSGNVAITPGAVDSLSWTGNDAGFTGTFTDTSYLNGTVLRIGNVAGFGSANAYFVFNNANVGSNQDITWSGTAGTLNLGSFTGSGSVGTGVPTGSTISAGNLNQNDLFSGTFAAFAFTKVGTGTQTFTGADSPGGPVLVNSGTLQIGAGGAGSIASATTTVAAGATLGFNTTSGNGSTISNSGQIIGNESTGVITALTGNITGTGTFAQTGAGGTSLAGADTFSSVVISNGVAYDNSTAGLGTGTITLAGGALSSNGNAPTITNTILAQAGTTSYLYESGTNFTVNGSLIGSGNISTGTLGVYSSLYLGGNNSGFTGTFTDANYGGVGNAMYVRFNSDAAGSANAAWVFNNTNASNYTTFNIASTGTISFGSFTGAGNLQNQDSTTTLQVGNLNDNDLFSGVAGTFNLLKVGTGTQTLTGADGFALTTVNGGTVQIGNGGTTGSTSGNFVTNANLAFDRSDSPTFGNISGTGTVTMMGTGTTTLNGTNTYSGATVVQNGTLQAGATNAFGTNAAVYMSNVAGATLNITGFNTQIGSLTGGGSLGGNVILGAATLTLGGDSASLPAYAGIISGTGALTKIGSGTEILSGANSYSGITTISAGTLQVGAGGATGAISTNSITDNGNLAIDLSSAYSLPSTISGSGSLTQSGTGTTTLAVAETYTGNTNINAGTLYVGTSLSTGTVTVNTGGTLAAGNAIIGGPVVVGGGGSINMIDGNATEALSVGGSVGTVPALTVGTGGTRSILGFDLDGAAIANDQIVLSTSSGGIYVGSSGATVDLNAITPLTGPGESFILVLNNSNTLAVGSAAINSTTFTIGATSGDFAGNSVSIGTDSDSDVVLNETKNAAPTNAYYYGGAAAVPAQGGTTAWNSFVNGNTNTSNFLATDSSGGTDDNGLVSSSTNVYFTAGGVTSPLSTSLGQNLSINSLNFSTPYAVTIASGNTLTIEGGGITNSAGNDIINAPVVLGASQTWTVGSGDTLTVNGIVSGSSKNLTTAGSGTTILTATESYTGTTTISAGTLQLGTGASAGKLATTSTIVDNGNFAIDRSNAVVQGTDFSGSAISGSGSFTQMGTGTTTLNVANSYTGGTFITAGTGSLTPGGTLYANGGVSGTSSATGGGAVNVGSYSTLAGSGVIRPTINGAGVVLAANSNLISGVVQTAGGSHTVATKGLTLDSSGETSGSVGKLLDATSGSANLTFYLGYGVTAGTGYANPNTNSSYLTATGTSASASGELAFATGDTITVNDLTSGNLNISLTNPYLLIQAGTTPLLASDDALYSGLLTSGMANIGSPEANGWVENLTLAGTAAGDTAAPRLYLYNGDLEIVPEPGTWALMLGGLGLLFFLQRRRNKA